MSRKYGVTFEKGVELLLLFRGDKEELSVAHMSEQLGLPSSTVYRFLKVLRDYEFLQLGDAPGHYRLGLRLFEMGRLVRSRLSIASIALPIMHDLVTATGETAILTIRFGLQAICAERVESPRALRLSFERGRPMPLHAGASSTVLVAFAEQREIDGLLKQLPLDRFTDRTITDPAELKTHLSAMRQRGYVFSDSEVDLDTRAIAAPVYDGSERLAAGLTVAGPAQRLPDERIAEVACHVVAAARQISTIAAEKGVYHG